MIDNFHGKYAFLSNFARCPILYEGITYPTSEHAFQAAKTQDVKIRQHIAGINTPANAKKYGRENIKVPVGWGNKRIEVMREIVKIKFSTNAAMRDRLLETGDEELVEGNTWGDMFWGKCWRNGKFDGSNWLGVILMEVRSELRNANNVSGMQQRQSNDDDLLGKD